MVFRKMNNTILIKKNPPPSSLFPTNIEAIPLLVEYRHFLFPQSITENPYYWMAVKSSSVCRLELDSYRKWNKKSNNKKIKINVFMGVFCPSQHQFVCFSRKDTKLSLIWLYKYFYIYSHKFYCWKKCQEYFLFF